MERIIDQRKFSTVGELLFLLGFLDEDSIVLNADTLTVIESQLTDGSIVVDVRIGETNTKLTEGSTT